MANKDTELLIKRKIIKIQDDYADILLRLDHWVKGTREHDDMKSLLARIYHAKINLLNDILNEIKGN